MKIGIIGAENSHAESFSKALNLADKNGLFRYDNMRVVKVFGEGDSAKILAEKVGARAVYSLADFDDCDSIMITSRRGSVHYKQALRFIEKGIPLFIDKPITVSIDEAKSLIESARRNNSLICGGSACKYAPDVLKLAEVVSGLRREKKLISASLNFNIFMNIEYDGFYFYAAHLIEIADTIFGKGLQSVLAKKINNAVVVVADYEDVAVSMHYTEGVFESSCTLYAKSGIVFQKQDISTIFDEELKIYADMLHQKKQPVSSEDLIYPVKVAEAIRQSYTSGIEMFMKDFL